MSFQFTTKKKNFLYELIFFLLKQSSALIFFNGLFNVLRSKESSNCCYRESWSLELRHKLRLFWYVSLQKTEIQGYPQEWDCKDDLKLSKYDNTKVELTILLSVFFLKDLFNALISKSSLLLQEIGWIYNNHSWEIILKTKMIKFKLLHTNV